MVVMAEPDENPPLVTIRYEELLDGSADLSDKIEQAYGQGALGILAVSGVPGLADMRGRLLPMAHRFAELPEDVRALYEDPESSWSFGWSQGRETLQDGKPDIYKGSFYANPCTDTPTEDPTLMREFPSYCRQDSHLSKPFQPFSHFAESKQATAAPRCICSPNIWPADEHAPGMEAAFKGLSNQIVDVGLMIIDQCDRYIKQQRPRHSPQSIRQVVAPSCCHKARLLHYFPPPPIDIHNSSTTNESPWCGMHRDHGALTGLTAAMYTMAGGQPTKMVDSSAGLWVETRRGKAVQIKIPADHVAYQVGEVVQILSGGLLCATPHYVQAPKPQLSAGVGRNTLAVFMQPHWDTKLQVPSWCNEEAIRRGKGLKGWSPGVTFGDFTKATLANYH